MKTHRVAYREQLKNTLKDKLWETEGKPVDYIRSLEAQLAEMKQVEQDLKRLAIIIKDSNDAITIQDLDGQILSWNRGAEKIYGYKEQEALNMNIFQLVPSDKRQQIHEFLKQLKNGEILDSLETQRITKNGKLVDIWLTVTPILDEEGEISSVATTERDITQKNALINQLVAMSFKDEVTTLYNRRGFIHFADKLLQLINRHNGTALLLYMDMDNLKWINDNLGHNKGDEAIERLAGVLQKTFRATDIVARMGGDEFAVLTEVEGGEEAITATLSRLRNNISKANEQNSRLPIAISIGAVASTDPTMSLEAMITRADDLMYEEKRQKHSKRGELAL